MPRSLLGSPAVLAVLITAANAAKPVTVDDTAYIAFARHVATSPTDPYGFNVFWWAKPEPAMQVLCPPVVPYWLAAGITVFGESPPLLKLWLFPFVWLLGWALRALLVRFARGVDGFALPLLMLSPAVLPTVNLMLDVPAVALALAAVQLFISACRVGGTRHLVATGTVHPPRANARATNWPLVIGAGLVAGLAMQTKYSAFVAPAAIAWFGLTHRRVGPAAVAAAVAIAVFVAWEWWLVGVYGRSHFETHARGVARSSDGGLNGLYTFALDKLELGPRLIGHVGCLAVGVGFLAVSTARGAGGWLAGAAATWYVGFALVATLPRRWTALDDDVTAGLVFWQASGTAFCVVVGACAAALTLRVRKGRGFRLREDAISLAGWLVAARLVLWQAGEEALFVAAGAFAAVLTFRVRQGLGFRLREDAVSLAGWLVTAVLVCRRAGEEGLLIAAGACAAALTRRIGKGLGFRPRADAIFLVGWLAVEVTAALALTPFPAARRVIGVTLVAGLVAARAASRVGRVRPEGRPARWVLAVGVAAGVAVAAIDALDAFPEKVCAESSAAVTRDRPDTATVWYVGHWGFQYYCEREGMRPLVAGETVARAGDFVVLPAYPDTGFNRPDPGFEVTAPAGAADEVAVVEWRDPLSAQTVPNFYGGVDPVASRAHPRLRVRVYRLRVDWVMPGG